MNNSPSLPVLTPAVTPLPAGVLASIKVAPGDAPLNGVEAYGSVWVVTHRGGRLYRIDPKTNKIVSRLDVGDQYGPPVPYRGQLIVGGSQPGAVSIVDPHTNRIVGTRPILGVWLLGGRAWDFGGNQDMAKLTPLDPKTLKPVASYPVKINLRHVSDPDTEVAYGDGKLWVTAVGDEDGTYGGAVVEVDPTTGRTLRTIHTPDPGWGADIEFLDHAVWLKGDTNDSLLRVDALTGHTRVYHLPGWHPLADLYSQPAYIADGDLWIRISSGQVARFDPKKGRVVATYPADPQGNGGSVFIADGSLWVANFSTDTFWRDRI